MANKAVKVKRPGCSGIYFIVCYFVDGFQVLAHFHGRAGGFLKRGAIRHIKHHLKLTFIIKGEHFHPYLPDADHCAGCEKNPHHARQKNKPPFWIFYQRGHRLSVKAG